MIYTRPLKTGTVSVIRKDCFSSSLFAVRSSAEERNTKSEEPNIVNIGVINENIIPESQNSISP